MTRSEEAFDKFMDGVPYVMFRNHGRVVTMSREEYTQAIRIARICRCAIGCDCCRAVEYHRERTGHIEPITEETRNV